MYERPGDIRDDEVVDALHARWGLAISKVDYAPLGFGSHHWHAGDYFVSVDRAQDQAKLQSALAVAHALRHDAGLDFVVAPIAAGADLVVPLNDAWVMHLYDRLDVVDDTNYGTHSDPEVVDLVQRIHAATPLAAQHAGRETFVIEERPDLEKALRSLDSDWMTGPFAERCRKRLRENEQVVEEALRRHDTWAAGVSRDGWVVTHGEPHRGNIFRTTKGWAVVDWDTALVGPPERDWWDMPTDRGDASVKDLYRFRWAVIEVACYVSLFVNEHADDANTRESWKNFEHYLDELTQS